MDMQIPVDALVRIKLVENGLEGTLPPSIQNFKNLVRGGLAQEGDAVIKSRIPAGERRTHDDETTRMTGN